MSYLLHPPLLDEVGFACAAEWYVEGFAKRTGTNGGGGDGVVSMDDRLAVQRSQSRMVERCPKRYR